MTTPNPTPAAAATALLPCPFCGSDEVSKSRGEKGDGSDWFYVECESCAACAEPEQWNQRADAAPQPAKREPLTDEEIDNTTRKQVDYLLDHIYEYGTAAEGINYRVRAIARAIERAHGIGGEQK